jgi:hypoxanthine phosphoribosyltransferase
MPIAKKMENPSTKPHPGHRPEESVRVLIPAARVKQRLKELAKEIRRDFPTEHLHLISVLKGSVFFLTDLARELGGEVSFDFLSVSSYGKGTNSTGEVKLIKDLDVSIEGRTVIVVEDILDTGLTLKYLVRFFEEKKPKVLRVVVLLDKVERRLVQVHADYIGFVIPNEFVVGYGLDFDERYRNLPDVCILQLAHQGQAKSESA